MPYFKWFGYDQNQQAHVGFIACGRSQEASVLLRQQGIECIHVKEIRTFLYRPCNFTDRMTVLQELSQLLNAQIRLSQALEIIGSLVKKEYVRQVLLDCMRSVQQGRSFVHTAQRYPELFDRLTVHALRAGHDAGLLAQACADRAKQLTDIAHIRSKVAHALTMPLMAAAFFVGMFIFLMLVILPQFKKIFIMLKTSLPTSTQFLLFIADFFTYQTFLIIFSLCAVLGVLFVTFLKTKVGKSLYDYFLVYFPGIRSIYQDLAQAQCEQTLALLLRSGSTLADALGHAAESFNNILISKQLIAVQESVRKGRPFFEAVDVCPLLAAPEIKSCLAIAHETAELEIILQQLSIIARNRALKKLDRLTMLIQPILLISLGLCIGLMLLALYIPLLQLPHAL